MFASTQRRLEQLLSPQLCLKPGLNASFPSRGTLASVAWQELASVSSLLLDTWQRRPGKQGLYP